MIEFLKVCIKLMDAHVLTKYTSVIFNQQCCNRNIRRLSRRKRHTYTKARWTNNPKDLKKKYREIQNNDRKECKKLCSKYINMLGKEGHTSKQLHSCIKSKKCDSSGVIVAYTLTQGKMHTC
jgi:hypothetical protein